MQMSETWSFYSIEVTMKTNCKWIDICASTNFVWNFLFVMNTLYLRNECLFFWVHGEWIVARDKQIAWTAKRFSVDLFVPRYDSFPMNSEKKTLIPYIYNASNKDSF